MVQRNASNFSLMTYLLPLGAKAIKESFKVKSPHIQVSKLTFRVFLKISIRVQEGTVTVSKERFLS